MFRRALLVTAAVLLVACDGAPEGLREWRPEDHDRPVDNGQQAAPPPGPAPSMTGAPRPANDGRELVELAWAKQCASCHGRGGKGDGPQGPMLHAADLTRPDWQDKTSDAAIAATIRKGKDKMPAFDLPPRVVDGLVKRIRASKGQ